VNELFAQLKALWDKMSSTQKIIFVGALVLVIGAIFLTIQIAGAPRYELLYSRMTEQDRSEVIAKLDELKVPYRTSASGGIEVPNALSVRASLLKEGIPHGGVVGWEIFDKNSFSTTDYTNQINRQRAIAGELTRTLQRIDGILDAKILLNMPDSSEFVFANDKPEGTASVQIQLRAPGVLSETQAEAILNLVTASTGIKRDNVTIIDNYANDLTAMLRPKKGSRMGSQSSPADLFTAKIEYESQVEKRIDSMLSKVFGFNKSVVRVTAELDLDYQEVKSETFADKGVPRSEQEKTETQQGTNASSSGIPGTDSNITTYKASDGGSSNFTVDKSERTVNYEISKVEEFRVGAPGKVRRLSVGVWVDGLSADNRQKVENTVAAAAGIMPERGDQLTVESIAFPTNVKKPQPPPYPWFTVIAASVLGILLLTLIIVVITKEQPVPQPEVIEIDKTAGIPADKYWEEKYKEEKYREDLFKDGKFKQEKSKHEKRKQDKSKPGTEVDDMPVPIIGTKIDKMIEDTALKEQAAGGLGLDTIDMDIPLEDRLRNERLVAISKLASEKPTEVAALLKAWLSED
jgi:flagellar M-ring protein FliF